MSIVPPPVIHCIGLANMDALAYVDESFLKKFGARKGTTVAYSGIRLDTIRAALPDPVYIPGGSAANTAASLAAHGHEVVYTGKTGDDEHGAQFRALFENVPVRFATAPAPDGTTSVCLVLVTPDKERSFLYSTDMAAWHLREEDLPDLSGPAPQIVYVEAYLATIQGKSGINLLSLLESALPKDGNTLIINIVDAAYLAAYKNHIFEILRARHAVLIGNMFEFSTLFLTDDPDDLREQAIDMDCDFVITKGHEGVIYLAETEYFALPAPVVDFDAIADTVAAGDYFSAGFIDGLMNGQDRRTCCARGIAFAFATESLKIPGARQGESGTETS